MAENGQKQPISLPTAILIAGFFIAVAIVVSGRNKIQQIPDTSFETSPEPSAPVRVFDARAVDTANEPVIGKADAPLVMAYWFDYQCPFCKRFEEQVLPSLIQIYVDTGKMKIVFKDFQFLGQDSVDAGLVANAVWHLYPDQYLAWNEAMFQAQDNENQGFGNMKSIFAFIKERFPNMDAAKISDDIAKNKNAYQQELIDDANEAQSYGISGTPGSIIGTQLVSGIDPANPLNGFTRTIDAELVKLGYRGVK